MWGVYWTGNKRRLAFPPSRSHSRRVNTRNSSPVRCVELTQVFMAGTGERAFTRHISRYVEECTRIYFVINLCVDLSFFVSHCLEGNLPTKYAKKFLLLSKTTLIVL